MSSLAFARSVGGIGRWSAPGHSAGIQLPSTGERPPSSASLIALRSIARLIACRTRTSLSGLSGRSGIISSQVAPPTARSAAAWSPCGPCRAGRRGHVHRVDLAGLEQRQPGRTLRDARADDRLDARRLAPVVGERLELDLAAGLLPDEAVRPGPDRRSVLKPSLPTFS